MFVRQTRRGVLGAPGSGYFRGRAAVAAGRPLLILHPVDCGVSPCPSFTAARPTEALSPRRGRPGPVTPQHEAALTPCTQRLTSLGGFPAPLPQPSVPRPQQPVNQTPGSVPFPWMPRT